MNYLELKKAIKSELNVDVYSKKMLKALAEKVKESDSLVSCFEFVDYENTQCLALATDSKLLITNDLMFKKSDVKVINITNIVDFDVKSSMFNQTLSIATQKQTIKLFKIKQKQQLNLLLSIF